VVLRFHNLKQGEGIELSPNKETVMAMTQEKWDNVKSCLEKIKKLDKEHKDLIKELEKSIALQNLWPEVFDYPPVRTKFASEDGTEPRIREDYYLWIKNDKEKKFFTLKEAEKAGFPFWKPRS
jgi:hypothetical protein